MNSDELLSKLEEIHFFEGYTAEAAQDARIRVVNQFQEGIRGENRRFFERFPGFALRFLGVDLELDGGEDLERILQQFEDDSFGMFRPTDVVAVCDVDEDVTRLEFRLEGNLYHVETEYSNWLPDGIVELIEGAFKAHCRGLGFHPVYFPEDTQEAVMTICTPRAFEAAVNAGLLPADHEQGSNLKAYGDSVDG